MYRLKLFDRYVSGKDDKGLFFTVDVALSHKYTEYEADKLIEWFGNDNLIKEQAIYMKNES